MLHTTGRRCQCYLAATIVLYSIVQYSSQRQFSMKHTACAFRDWHFERKHRTCCTVCTAYIADGVDLQNSSGRTIAWNWDQRLSLLDDKPGNWGDLIDPVNIFNNSRRFFILCERTDRIDWALSTFPNIILVRLRISKYRCYRDTLPCRESIQCTV